MLYLDNRDNFGGEVDKIKAKLKSILPKICKSYDNDNFINILHEFETYSDNVISHYNSLIAAKIAWDKILSNLMLS